MALDRKTILLHAFAILNESGYESLTLRRLALGLGVQAPAIYWHFKNKQELLDEMGTQVIREAIADAPPEDAAQSWESWAIAFGLGLRRTLLRYREGARMFSGTYLTDATLYAAQDASLRKLTGGGFTLRAAVYGITTIYSYTIGFVIEEQSVRLMQDEANPQYDLENRNRRIDPEMYPLAYAAGREAFTNYELRFLSGLETIVSGMGQSLKARADTEAGPV